MSDTTRVEALGSAYIEMRLQGRWALSVLTNGWTDDERQALLNGDEDARQALEDAAIALVQKAPDELDVERFDVTVSRDLDKVTP